MTVLLDASLRLDRAQEKTNIYLPFFLPCAAAALQISVSYTPKTAEDDAALALAQACLQRDAGEFAEQYPPAASFLPLKNLITLSLDDPNGYRGAAHRQAPTQVFRFTPQESPNGFSAGEVPAGLWRLALHLHALVTPFCVCRVCVEMQEADR